MTDGMTLEEFLGKYPFRRRLKEKNLSYEYSYELAASKTISIREEVSLTSRDRRLYLKWTVGELLFKLDALLQQAKEDFERITDV